ncbi:MAG: hypothetical protein LIO90_06775 [Bacteroidales bacterium]|nr:hypothetical protein [Bacteroidales bacterium]
MTLPKLVFRADGSSAIGYGHYVRCLALAEMLNNDWECSLYTVAPSGFQRTQATGICSLKELDAESHLQDFLDALNGDEVVVLDNYFFTEEYQKAIKDKGCRLVCLGTNDRHYYSDILLNFAEWDPSIFDVEPNTRIVLGREWAILRKPFREPHLSFSKKDLILICLGGTDQFCLSEKCLPIIQESLPNWEIGVVATDRYEPSRIRNFEEKEVNVFKNLSGEEMCNLFLGAKCIVCSASTVVHEALVCGVVPLCGYYVENQERMYTTLERRHDIIPLGNMLEDSLEQRLSQALTVKDCFSLPELDYSQQSALYNQLFNTLIR